MPKLAAAESESAIPIVVITRKAAAGLGTGSHAAKLTGVQILVSTIFEGAKKLIPGDSGLRQDCTQR